MRRQIQSSSNTRTFPGVVEGTGGLIFFFFWTFDRPFLSRHFILSFFQGPRGLKLVRFKGANRNERRRSAPEPANWLTHWQGRERNLEPSTNASSIPCLLLAAIGRRLAPLAVRCLLCPSRDF